VVKNDWSYTSAHPTFLHGVDTDLYLYLYLYLYECKLKLLTRQIRSWELKKNCLKFFTIIIIIVIILSVTKLDSLSCIQKP